MNEQEQTLRAYIDMMIIIYMQLKYSAQNGGELNTGYLTAIRAWEKSIADIEKEAIQELYADDGV